MSGKFIDFDEVRQAVSWEQAADLLNLDYKSLPSGQIRCGCPVHPDPDNRRMLITPEKGFFCGKGGQGGRDVIALAAHVLEIGQKDAAHFLAGKVQVPGKGTVPYQETVPKESGGDQTKKLEPLAYLEYDHEAVVVNNLDPRVAEQFGIGFAPKGVARGNLVIPIRDEHGTLHGYLGTTELTFVPKDFQPADNVVPLHPKRSA